MTVRGGRAPPRRGTPMRHANPPGFSLVGKTQSGKTSVVKYPTGAADAEGGEGLRPLTCRPEAYPQRQPPAELPTDDKRSLAEQERRFTGLVDVVVPIDLTRPEEGFTEANYNGEALKDALVEKIPSAYRQALLALGHA